MSTVDGSGSAAPRAQAQNNSGPGTTSRPVTGGDTPPTLAPSDGINEEPIQSQPDPAFDAVRIRINRRIAADYAARAVLPTLHRSPDMLDSSAAAVVWCSPGLVEDILEDARRRSEQVSGSLQAAYTSLIKVVEKSKNDAKWRCKWLSGTSAFLLREHCDSKVYYATPTQFASLDLPSDLRLPGNPNGPARRASYKDADGRRCSISRAFDVWPSAYQVTRHLTKAEVCERRAMEEAKRPEPYKPRTHESASAFRSEMVHLFALSTGATLNAFGSRGFAFTPDVLSLVRQKLHEAEYLLRSGQVIPTSQRPAECVNSPPRAVKPRLLQLVHSSGVVQS